MGNNVKRSKSKITALICVNMDGREILKLLVRGKANNPECFKII